MRKWIARALRVTSCVLIISIVGLAADKKFTEVSWESRIEGVLEQGRIRCPGHGEANYSTPPFFCPAGSHTIVRDRVFQSRVAEDKSSDPRIVGTTRESLNYNLDPEGSGPSWGTCQLTNLNGVVTWEGYSVGNFDTPMSGTVRVMLFGTGPYRGLKLKATGTFGFDPQVGTIRTTFKGRIKEEPGKDSGNGRKP